MIEILEDIDSYMKHVKRHKNINQYRIIKLAMDSNALDKEFDKIINKYDIYELTDAVCSIIKSYTVKNNVEYHNDYFRINDTYVYIELYDATVFYYSNSSHKRFRVNDDCFTYEIYPNTAMSKNIKNKWDEYREEIIDILHDILLDIVYLIED